MIRQRGNNYWVLYNYFQAEKQFNCDESITFTTHAKSEDLLDHLETLIDRWRGPISIAIFTPFDDYINAVNTIIYLRQCQRNFLTIRYYD